MVDRLIQTFFSGDTDRHKRKCGLKRNINRYVMGTEKHSSLDGIVIEFVFSLANLYVCKFYNTHFSIRVFEVESNTRC